MAFKSSLTSTTIDKFGSLVHKGFNKLTGTVQESEVKITASDAAAADIFGRSVAVGNGRIVVGADGDDDGGLSSGSAYIFDLNGTQIAKITASDAAAYDVFGYSVAVGSGRIVVSAYGNDDGAASSGSAYIFDLNGTQIAKITASDGAAYDEFGNSVAVGNGRIVVGAHYNNYPAGSAYIFDLDGTQIAKIVASDATDYADFGQSVAVGNGRIVVGAYGDNNYTGSAFIFDLNGTQIAKITASDAAADAEFGVSVAVGSGRIVVGADYGNNYTGSAYIFDLDGTQIAKITASDPASNDYFGRSVAVGSGIIVVGADGNDDAGALSGSAYIFNLDGTQIAKITASDAAAYDYFGFSVAVDNGRIVVGAYGNDDGAASTGSAYIYQIEENFDNYIENIVKS